MPPRANSKPIDKEGGTASVELIATLPLLLLAILVAMQIALAGQALWSAAVAARAGARASLVGRDAEASARRELPVSMRKGAQIDEEEGISVQVPIPRLLPAMPPLKVGAKVSLGPGDG